MSRRGKAILFIVGATIANMLLTALFFLALLGIYGLTLGRVLKVATVAPVILGAFVLAVVLSSIVYAKTLKFLKKRYNLEEKLGIK